MIRLLARIYTQIISRAVVLCPNSSQTDDPVSSINPAIVTKPFTLGHLRKEVIINIEKHFFIWDLRHLYYFSNHSNFIVTYAEINSRSQLSKKEKKTRMSLEKEKKRRCRLSVSLPLLWFSLYILLIAKQCKYQSFVIQELIKQSIFCITILFEQITCC